MNSRGLGKGILTTSLQQRFAAAWREKQVIFFGAPCGFGKTTAANALVAGLVKPANFCRWDAAQLASGLPEIPMDCEAVVLDNLQLFQGADRQQELAVAIEQRPEVHFVLLSRGRPPGWLLVLEHRQLLHSFDYHALMLDVEAAARLAHAHGLELSQGELERLQKNCLGYPLALAILCRQLQTGAVYDKHLDTRVRQELFGHFQEAVYRQLPKAAQGLLLSLAPFDSFDVDFAQAVTGNSRAGEVLGELQQDSSMFLYDDLRRCHFWQFFQDYLLWQQERELDAGELKGLYHRAALYYEGHGDLRRALDCYVKCGEHDKVSELLLMNSEQHPGLAHFEEMEPYYRALPREKILASPALMCGMSMLCAVCMDYEESERWYQELKSYALGLHWSDPNCAVAKGRLAYLDIGLPQRSVAGAVDIIKKAAVLLTSREIVLPEFSVTSCLPSIMNGGKDFCQWSKSDDLLYQTLRLPVKLLLGRDGVGLPECAIAESKFEKGENISGRVLDLLARLDVIQRKGTPDLEFAVIGLLVRLRIDQGEPGRAREHLEALRERFVPQDRGRFLANIDALLCRVALYEGDDKAVEEWYRERAPKDLLKLRVMLRYQYMTRLLVELANGSYQEARLIIATLRPYFEGCRRVMDMINLRLLEALCCHRAQEGDWREPLLAALDTCLEYQFIRPVSQYGVAMLPLLEQCGWQGDRGFWSRLMGEVRQQASLYPDFLCQRGRLVEPLLPAELRVLRLLCHHKTNAEIGQILGIKLPTVKTHVSNVLRKLGVKNRSAVKDAAQRLHLF